MFTHLSLFKSLHVRVLIHGLGSTLFLILSPRLFGQPQGLNDAWRWVRFGVESGLPAEHILQVEESWKGDPWVRTGRGIAWYDGFQWKRVPGDPLTESEVGRAFMAPDSDGVLVVVDARLYSYTPDSALRVPLQYNGAPLLVRKALALRDGSVVLQGDSLLYLSRDGSIEILPSPYANPLTPKLVEQPFSIFSGRGKDLWLYAVGGVYRLVDSGWRLIVPAVGEQLELTASIGDGNGNGAASVATRKGGDFLEWYVDKPPVRKALPAGDMPVSMDESPSGEAVLLSVADEIRWRHNDRWKPLIPLPTQMVNCLLLKFSSNGDLWIGGESGLYLCLLSSRMWVHEEHLPGDRRNNVNEILRTSSGQLWLGTSQGIEILSAAAGTRWVNSIEGRELGVVTGLAEAPDGEIFVSSGSTFGGTYRWDGKRWMHLGTNEGLCDGPVHRIIRDREGRLWFLGISSLPPGAFPDSEPGAYAYLNHRFTHWGKNEGLLDGRVYALTEDVQGGLWFGTLTGLNRFKDGKWTYWTEHEGLRAPKVFALAVDSKNRTWFGHQQHGLGYIDSDDRVQYLSLSDGLPSETVWSLAVDSAENVWVGTRGGIGCYHRGVWYGFSTVLGLPTPYIWPILPEDGRLYVGTQGAGLAVLNYSALTAPQPRVRFLEPMARGERTLIQWNAFAYYGELPSDRIETRYKVDQSPWSAWSTRRELSLREISSGSHTLEVQAKGLFGDLPVHGKTVDFEVLPPFYGRPAFYLPVGVLGSLLLTLGYLSRARERKFDRALREQDAAYRAVVEQQSELIFQILPNGALTFVNEAFCRFFSMRRDELLGRKFFDIISPEASREVMEKISRLTPEEPLLTVEAEVRRPEGNAWLNWTHKAIVDEHNNVVAFQSTGRDITDRKRFEDQLIASLKEKEVLLKEIHHRVKNNLQVISSLLNLQIGSLKDARDIEVFKESQNRVKSMALIHERLYQSGNLARIDFKEYLSSLVGHLSRSYPIGEVSFEEDVDELMLEIDTAIPCGLIVNELVSNALKHAFVGRSGGKVQVTLHALENQHCRLTVNDNGVGFPPGIEYRDASTLGLQLVNVLTGQLNGSLDITVANGTTFVITFPMKLQESIH